jgi:phage FluMu gp28-like protein
MSATLPFVKIDSSSFLPRFFTRYQICWIEAEDPFHEAKRQVFALAEKSVRIGWTFCDGFKNVRKRLRFKNRDYLFVTKDWPSALEYMNNVYTFADMLGYTRALLSHGEDLIKVKSLDPEGRPTSLTEEVKIGYMKFQNGSRIIAFSSNPYAMAVYGGDVGIDEFAKHPNAKLLWQTAQARVTWACDLAVWSSHDGEDTLFNQFAQQARACCPPSTLSPTLSPTLSNPVSSAPAAPLPSDGRGIKGEGSESSLLPTPHSALRTPQLWNLYFRVTMPDAIELGLLDVINRTKDTRFTPNEFITNCQARSGSEEVYQQSYMCNPLGAATASIVEWSAIERCRDDYSIERVHFEADQVLRQFGQLDPANKTQREAQIHAFLRSSFPNLFAGTPGGIRNTQYAIGGTHHASRITRYVLRLGFDVAASGEGDLAVIYIDEAIGNQLHLRALFTCRTQDWHFLKTVLHFFMALPHLQAAGDESGLGSQICWEAASQFGSRFLKVNFTSKKQELGFALMNQLSVGEKHFPRSEQDIAADFFALRKFYTGTRWTFTEGRNTFNPASHCDIAWAGALASHAHTQRRCTIGAAVLMEDGTIWSSDHPNEPRHLP